MPIIKYQDIALKASSLELIATSNAIIAEYAAQGFELTLRQLYYQLVSRDIIRNQQKEYKRLGSIINDGRLAGLIDWDAIVDRTRELRSVSHWSSPQQIIDAIAEQYRIDKWKDQSIRPEVWIEKDALIGVIENVCRDLDISYFSCRGYTSQSEMWSAAMRFVQYAKNGQQAYVIHLGDHDPSGKDMSRDIEERINMFMHKHLGSVGHCKFQRVALNMDQVELYNPPPNPAKLTDSRATGYIDAFGDSSWELDALSPTVIAALIRKTVQKVRNAGRYKAQEQTETLHRDLLQKTSDNWMTVVDTLEAL